jgi:hypothetical protein
MGSSSIEMIAIPSRHINEHGLPQKMRHRSQPSESFAKLVIVQHARYQRLTLAWRFDAGHNDR